MLELFCGAKCASVKKRPQQLSAVPCGQVASSQCGAPGMRKYGVVNLYYSQQRRLILKLPSGLIYSLSSFRSFLFVAALLAFSLLLLISLFVPQKIKASDRACAGLLEINIALRGAAKKKRINNSVSSFSFLPFFLLHLPPSSFFYRLLLLSSSIFGRARRVCWCCRRCEGGSRDSVSVCGV